MSADATCNNEGAKCLHVGWAVSACEPQWHLCVMWRRPSDRYSCTVQVQNIDELTSLTSPVVLLVNVSANQINNWNQFSKLTPMSNFFMKLISFPSAFIALVFSMFFFFSILSPSKPTFFLSQSVLLILSMKHGYQTTNLGRGEVDRLPLFFNQLHRFNYSARNT